MRQLSRREYTLLGLLALAGVVLFYFAPKAGIGGAAGHESFGDVAKLGEAPVVNLDRLAGRTDRYDPDGRNLFQYYTPPPPVVAPPPTPPPTPRPIATPPPVMVNRDPPDGRAYRPQPPAINLTYLGFLGPKDNRIAVFEDGQEMLLAKKGEVVKQQFRVVDFGFETVVMGYVDERFRGETQELPQQAGAAGAAGRSRGRR